MARPEYLEADANDRIAYIGSRNNVLSKSFATDLWMKVIHRAIDDIVTYKVSKENKKNINEEELEAINDAYGFLFHDEYKIPFDDYLIDIECSECKTIFTIEMSIFSSGISECNFCNKLQSINVSSYSISKEQQIKEINLREILEFWSIEDINGFRSGVRERIEELIKRKKITINKRLELKKEKKKNMGRKNELEKIKDLSDELWREYDFCGRVYRIEKPKSLHYKLKDTTHRIVDYNNIVHCVPAPGYCGCILRLKLKIIDPNNPIAF